MVADIPKTAISLSLCSENVSFHCGSLLASFMTGILFIGDIGKAGT